MKVHEIMTQTVKSVRPDETAEDAAVKLRDHDIGSLPVYDGLQLLGVVSDRDLTIRVLAEAKDPHSTLISDVMSPEVICCSEDDDVDEAADLMQQRLIRRLIVVNHDGRMTGILSLSDLATQQPDKRIVVETVEQVSEPTHATFFQHSPGEMQQGPSDDKGVSR